MSTQTPPWEVEPIDPGAAAMLQYFLKMRKVLTEHLQKYVRKKKKAKTPEAITTETLDAELSRYMREFFVFSTVERSVYKDLSVLISRGIQPVLEEFSLAPRSSWTRLRTKAELTYLEEVSPDRPPASLRRLQRVEKLEKEVLEHGLIRLRWGTLRLLGDYPTWLEASIGTEPFFLEKIQRLRFHYHAPQWTLQLLYME